MADTELPWRIFGRLIRPYALAVSLATLVIVWSIATEAAVGQLLDGPPGRIVVAAAAALAVALLWAGWWMRSDRLMRAGLIWTTGVWAAVGGTAHAHVLDEEQQDRHLRGQALRSR